MIFLDVNILLEVALGRNKIEKVKELLGSEEEIGISLLSVHLFYHFGIKNRLAMSKIDEFLADILMLPGDKEVYNLAKKIRKDNDFEDALQVATAIYNKPDFFKFSKKPFDKTLIGSLKLAI